ncbi:MAG: asparagine synthase (glutamine-hydrolyzing) [Acidobacteriota bacterium]|jgi:asparagine synthase (glutamine-hydrolysing)
MCGICGKLSPRGASVEEVRRMAATLTHRGPDDEGYFVRGPIALGHRRLSIIDLDSGRQPVPNEDETVWVVNNGEIYNYRELRAELEARGHRFRTSSDTEVIVHLYEEKGERALDDLRGMFALAVWDEREQSLLLARDRLGQKPLYYSTLAGDLIFASEIKALLAGNGFAREVDTESLSHWLSLRFVPAPGTLLRGVQKLPAAHWLRFREGAIEVRRYWSPPFGDKLALTEDEALEVLAEKLTDAVRSHMVSDVPVGAFLSGGMDSGTVVALMATLGRRSFPTFSIGSDNASFDELPLARLVAERYHTEHHEERATPDLMRLIPRIVYHLDEPTDPIAACMFHASQLASREVKVVLGGDGGDELFAGFDRYWGVHALDRVPRGARALSAALGSLAAWAVPSGFGRKSTTEQLRWVARLLSIDDPARRYAESFLFFRFDREQKKALLGSAGGEGSGEPDSAAVVTRHFEAADSDDPLDRMLYADYLTRLPEHTLMLADRMGMANGIEIRSPLLDHELVEFCCRLPADLKIRGRTLKYGLRRVARDYLPSEILRSGKHGFQFPIADWFAGPLDRLVAEYLPNAATVRDGIFRRPAIMQLIDEHRRRRADHHVRIWMALTFDVWYRMTVCGNDPRDIETELAQYG